MFNLVIATCSKGFEKTETAVTIPITQMTGAAMRAPLTALFLATSMLVGASKAAPADKIPNFDVTAACRAVAAQPDAIPDDRQAQGTQHCVDDELTAREQLVKQWSQFKPADRAMCLGGSRAGAVNPVYTELITCLEVARDAELLDARTTTPTERSTTTLAEARHRCQVDHHQPARC